MVQVIALTASQRIVAQRFFLNLPDETVATTLTAPAAEGRDAQTVLPLATEYLPANNTAGIARMAAGKGLEILKAGVYTVELQDSIQFSASTDSDIEFGWVIFHVAQNGVPKDTYIHGELYRLDVPDAVAPIVYANNTICEVGDYFYFIRSFKGKQTGYTVRYTARTINIPGTQIPEVDRRFGVTRLVTERVA